MTLLYLGSAVLASLGCERGCERTNAGEALAVKQDCPTGLARCVSGAVEISAGHAACNGCPCGWTRVSPCDKGCAIENEVLVREPGQAATLCKRVRTDVTPAPPDAGSIQCPAEGERFVCQSGTVHACPGTSSVPVGVCSFGCAVEGETLGDPSVDILGATSVLCATKGSHDP